MLLLQALSAVAGVAAAVAAWIGLVSPRARARRARRQAVEDRILGREPVLDHNGQPITPRVPSIFEQLLERPALNGEWTELRTDVAHLKSWTETHTAEHRRQRRRAA